ncbi:MAG: diguanylate cyclase [Methylovulum sp.]|nr:diguanylate cyclase [Methylovulum sp.]
MRIAYVLLGLCGVLTASSALALDQVTLQLKWTHGFQFAGYYAAQAQGYYREAGLDVRVAEAQPGMDPVNAVVESKADFGVGTSSLLLQREAGIPVVALAAIFQHSPYVLIMRQDHAAQSIQDITGKRVMLEPQADELVAYLENEGVPLKRITQLEHSHNPQDLIDGKADAMSAYVTNEPYYLNIAHIPYQAYTPRSVGIDFYGDTLFTTEPYLSAHPKRVQAFRAASLRGWRYAMAHQREISELIFNQYSQQHPLDFYQFEAKQMMSLIQPDIIEMGYMNPGRWRHIADTYADLGMLPRGISLDGFLYEPNPQRDLTWLYLTLAIALALIAVSTAITGYIYAINRKLKHSITALHRVQQELAASEKLYRFLVETMRDVVWIADPVSLRFRYISPSIKLLRGYSAEEIIAKPIDDGLLPDYALTLKQHIQQHLDAFLADPHGDCAYRQEVQESCKDGGTIWTEIIFKYYRNAETQQVELHGVTRDITERKQVEDRIKHMALHDALTGLPNRTLFSDRLQQALAEAQRDQEQLALIYLDLDKFKPVNDNFGHGVGDLLLKAVTARIQNCLRQADTVARIGGDEFMLLLRTIPSEQTALQIAEKIRDTLSQVFDIDGQHLAISCSAGIAVYPEHGDNETALAQHADIAMYYAKAIGRNNIQIFRMDMLERC